MRNAAVARGDRVAFIGVNMQDTEGDARTFLANYGIPYRKARDVSGTVQSQYASTVVPVTVFISADGVIRRIWIGVLDEQQLPDSIDAIQEAPAV